MLVMMHPRSAHTPQTQRSGADGPTPYPNAADVASWPGQGPIACYEWIGDNRKAFWSQRERDQGKVVLAGDSLIAGWSPEMLAETFGQLQFANRGIGGDTSRGLLFRFDEDVLDLNPIAIVIGIGSNDMSRNGEPAATEANIACMIEKVRAHAPATPVILCCVPPRSDKDAPARPGAMEDLNARIGQLAKSDEHLLCIDTFSPFVTARHEPIMQYFREDKVHLAKAGYVEWGKLLKAAFHTLGVHPASTRERCES
jgi:lysophospholipase L1-like esterase